MYPCSCIFELYLFSDSQYVPNMFFFYVFIRNNQKIDFIYVKIQSKTRTYIDFTRQELIYIYIYIYMCIKFIL